MLKAILCRKASPSDITMTWRKDREGGLVCHTWFSIYGSVLNKRLTDMYICERAYKQIQQCGIFRYPMPYIYGGKALFQACLCKSTFRLTTILKSIMIANHGSFFFLTSSNRIRCQMIPPQIMHFIVVQGIEICYLGNQLQYTMLVFVNWLIE